MPWMWFLPGSWLLLSAIGLFSLLIAYRKESNQIVEEDQRDLKQKLWLGSTSRTQTFSSDDRRGLDRRGDDRRHRRDVFNGRDKRLGRDRRQMSDRRSAPIVG